MKFSNYFRQIYNLGKNFTFFFHFCFFTYMGVSTKKTVKNTICDAPRDFLKRKKWKKTWSFYQYCKFAENNFKISSFLEHSGIFWRFLINSEKITKIVNFRKITCFRQKRESGIFYNFLLIIALFWIDILMQILNTFPYNSCSKFNEKMVGKVV